MPDSEGRFRPISVPRIPWHEEGGARESEERELLARAMPDEAALDTELGAIQREANKQHAIDILLGEDPDPPLDNERKVEE